MMQFLKKRGAIIGGAMGLVVLITVLSVSLSPGRVSFLHNGMHAIMRPVESGVRALVQNLERAYDYMHNYDQLEEDYLALRDRLAAYQRIVREAEEVRDENERLRELLALPDRLTQVYYIDAYLLSWDASNWASAFTIDKGEDFGIAIGDPVMTERQELIGVVRDVGRTWATVSTVIDPGLRVGASLGSGISAIAEGHFALMQDGQLRLSHVPAGGVPQVGDTIITSGLGDTIPQGLIIGQVTETALEDTGLGYWATLAPAADLSRVAQVFVVKQIG